MTKQEWYRLLGFHRAKQNAPYTTAQGKRHVKGRAKHVGVVLKASRIVPGVSVERVFPARAL